MGMEELLKAAEEADIKDGERVPTSDAEIVRYVSRFMYQSFDRKLFLEKNRSQFDAKFTMVMDTIKSNIISLHNSDIDGLRADNTINQDNDVTILLNGEPCTISDDGKTISYNGMQALLTEDVYDRLDNVYQRNCLMSDNFVKTGSVPLSVYRTIYKNHCVDYLKQLWNDYFATKKTLHLEAWLEQLATLIFIIYKRNGLNVANKELVRFAGLGYEVYHDIGLRNGIVNYMISLIQQMDLSRITTYSIPSDIVDELTFLKNNWRLLCDLLT